MIARNLAAIQLSHQGEIMKACEDVQDHAHRDQHGAKPELEPVAVLRSHGTKCLHLFEKQPKARHHKAKAHQSQPGANPRKKGALSGKIIAEPSLLV